MKFLIVFITISLMLRDSTYAQDEVAIKKLFNTYIQELNDLNKNKDLKRVLNLLDPEFEINETYIGLTGKVVRTTNDRADHANELQIFISDDKDVKLGLTIDEITNIKQGTKMATISATLTMDIIADGISAEKGGFTVNMAARLNNKEEWKFIQSDNIRTVEERNSGTCACFFYERKSGFVTELYYPVGFEYTKILDVFTINQKKKTKTIGVNYKQYEWEKGGELFDPFGDDGRTKIGSVQDEKDAIILILGQMYEDHCLDFLKK